MARLLILFGNQFRLRGTLRPRQALGPLPPHTERSRVVRVQYIGGATAPQTSHGCVSGGLSQIGSARPAMGCCFLLLRRRQPQRRKAASAQTAIRKVDRDAILALPLAPLEASSRDSNQNIFRVVGPKAEGRGGTPCGTHTQPYLASRPSGVCGPACLARLAFQPTPWPGPAPQHSATNPRKLAQASSRVYCVLADLARTKQGRL